MDKLRMRRRRRSLLKRATPLYIMLILPMAWYILFCYVPMYGVTIAFKDYGIYLGIQDSPWVGLKHFKSFLTDEYFWNVVANTLRVGCANLLITFPAPIILAILLNEVTYNPYKRVLQTVSYMPYFISTVALVNIISTLLSPSEGIINKIIQLSGRDPINFLQEGKWFVPIYVVIMLWKGTGWNSIIYLATLSNVDTDLYEAATMDGANRWQRIRYITLPAIMPVVGMMLILAMPSILGADFETVLLLQRPVTYNYSDVVGTYTYRRGLQYGYFDVATAIGLMFSIISIIIILLCNKIAKMFSDGEVGLW